MTIDEPYTDKTRLESAIKNKLEFGQKGVENAVSGKDFVNWLITHGFSKLTHRQLRMAIRNMRRDGEPICSKAGQGYFWPTSLNEIKNCVEVEFQKKAKDMLFTGKLIMDAGIHLFGAQRGLDI